MDTEQILQPVRRNAEFAFRIQPANWVDDHDYSFGNEFFIQREGQKEESIIVPGARLQ